MQPALGRRRHRRINTTISLVSRGYAVGFTCVLIAAVKVRRGSARFAPCHEGLIPLLSHRAVSRRQQKAL
jgi:hypothetical protein